MNNRCIIKFLLLFFAANCALAQLSFNPGYVVLQNGDTLKGEIRELNAQTIYFRPNKNSPSQIYTPHKVTTYQVEGINRLPIPLTEEGVDTIYFMKENIKDYVSLYNLFQPVGRLTHAIRLPDKSFVSLRGSLALITLTNHLTKCDNPQFLNLLRPGSFQRTNTYYERIIEAYNQCVSPLPGGQSKHRPKERLRFEAGLLAGGLRNSWVYGPQNNSTTYYDPYKKYGPFYTATVGVFFSLTPSKRLAFTVEAFATLFKGSLSVPLIDPLDPQAQNIRIYSFEEKYLAAPITARYVFIEGPVSIYVKAGIATTLRTSLSGRFSSSALSTDIPFLHKSFVGMGYLAGIGAIVPLTKKQQIYVELRTMPHMVPDGVTNVAISQSLQLTVSVPIINHDRSLTER